MSTRQPFIRPFRFLVAFFVLLTPLALAVDVILIGDHTIDEGRSPTTALAMADAALAFNGSAIEVHALGSGDTLEAIGPGFSSNAPRLDPGVVTERAEATRHSPRIQSVVGGVVIQHRTTVEWQVRNAYIAALGELGFTLHVASDPSTLLFTNGDASVRVHVISFGENVMAYVGR
jgi:hypothetical protein